jgi:regulator of replication initiation timing
VRLKEFIRRQNI